MTTQYIGARYVPVFADPVEWSSTKDYEPLTIVMHEGNSYTSKQFVPVGINIANDDYWALTGNYNAQVEQYRRETEQSVETNREYTDAAVSASREYTDAAVEQVNEWLTNAQETYSDKPFAFDTVSDMQESDALYEGAICHTNGFHSSGDGGAAWYEIGDTGPANGMDVLACRNNLFATLKLTDLSVINIMQLGADKNGVADNTNIFLRAIEIIYANNPVVYIERDNPRGGGEIYIPNGTYVVNSALGNPNIIANIKFRGATKGNTVIKTSNNYFVEIGPDVSQAPWNLYFENLTFIGNAISIIRSYNTYIKNCKFYNATFSIVLYLVVGSTIEDCYFTGNSSALTVSGSAGSGPSTTLCVRRCWFTHNTTALTLSFSVNGIYTSSFIDCIFEYNQKAINAAGSERYVSLVDFKRIHFENNVDPSTLYNISFKLHDCYYDATDKINCTLAAYNEAYIEVPTPNIITIAPISLYAAKRIVYDILSTGYHLDTLLGELRLQNTKQFILNSNYVPTKAGVVIEYHSDTKNCMAYGTFTRNVGFSLQHLMETFATNALGTIAITDDNATNSYLTIKYRNVSD